MYAMLLPQARGYLFVWNFAEGENLRRDLEQQPADDCISDRDFVTIAPLQLGKEVVDLHWMRLGDERVEKQIPPTPQPIPKPLANSTTRHCRTRRPHISVPCAGHIFAA